MYTTRYTTNHCYNIRKQVHGSETHSLHHLAQTLYIYSPNEIFEAEVCSVTVYKRRLTACLYR